MFWKCLFFCQIEVIVQFFNILFICPHKASHDGAIISSTSRHYKSAEREKIGKNVFRLKPRPSDVLPQHWRTTVRRKLYHLSFFNQCNHSFDFSTGQNFFIPIVGLYAGATKGSQIVLVFMCFYSTDNHKYTFVSIEDEVVCPIKTLFSCLLEQESSACRISQDFLKYFIFT